MIPREQSTALTTPAHAELVEARAQPVTIAAALREATATLAPTSDTARLDAELLMAHALGVTRSELLLRHMDAAPPAAFAPLLARRQWHEPVAYILGRQEFRSLDFLVTPAVLIPRGDSEVVVDAALAAKPDARRVLDCGTGSGALLLATLAGLPQAQGIGTDRSLGALAVAAANAAMLGLAARARLLRADWETPGWSNDLGQFDLILVNPPYVEAGAPLHPSVRAHEPSGALFAGAEGLDAYRILIPQLAALLAPHGVAVIEIGAAQGDSVGAIAAQAGFTTILHHDLAGRPRALECHISLGKARPSA